MREKKYMVKSIQKNKKKERKKYKDKFHKLYFRKRNKYMLSFCFFTSLFIVGDLISTYFGLKIPDTYETNIVLSFLLSYFGNYAYILTYFYDFLIIYGCFSILSLLIDSTKIWLKRYLQLDIFIGIYALLAFIFIANAIKYLF